MVHRQFKFLQQPLKIEIGDTKVAVSFAEESKTSQDEAERLTERAAKRANEGDFAKAISLWKRVLELHPSLHRARRDLAMACMETGDIDSAKNHLIEILRLNPADSWSWVVLGNIYAKNEKDWGTAEKFLRRALDLAPKDAWALNGLATITAQRGQTEEAVRIFKQAIQSNPELPNAHYGLAVTYSRSEQHDRALSALDQLFSKARLQDARSRIAFESGRDLYAQTERILVPQQHPEAFKAVENLRAELERSSGYQIRVTEGEFKDTTGATIQMAWKHERDHHLIKCRASQPEHLRTYLMAHELIHLQLEIEARTANKNRFFITTEQTEALATKRIQHDLQKLQRRGYPDDSIQTLVKMWFQGLAGFLYNCPLDMLIETRMRDRMPALSAAQFESLRISVEEVVQTNANPEIRQITPPLILRASLALNGAYTLFLDNLYRGATNYAAHYQKEETFSTSQRLFRYAQDGLGQLGPGQEYELVDEFAEIIGVRGWFEWKTDPGTHEFSQPPAQEGTTNPGLLQKKHLAAVHYFLDVLKRYDKLPVEKIREIAVEVGTVGRNGLDYASPDKKYQLASLPDEAFSGLQLMCFMYAGFKRLAPDHDLGMDLNEPFLKALEIFQKGDSAQAT
jgi:tetratricopeptide (TPR) repeat protein